MEVLKVCPVCGSGNIKFYSKTKDYLVSKNEFSIEKCSDCGFLFTNPRPFENDLGDYYLSGEYISHTDSKKSFWDFVYHTVRKFMLKKKISFLSAHLISKINNSKLMDYGCGTGEFLLYARQRGFDVLGIEPSPHARNRASAKGITVEPGLEHLQKGERKFHVITLWHVLEHIPDPRHIISDLINLLGKDGLIVVAVPEYLSFDSKFYKEDWAAWDVPRHLNHFNSETISKLFATYGFKMKGKHPLIFDSFYVSMLSEKNKNSGLFGIMRALWVGLMSNVRAVFGRSAYSSQVYIFSR